jgi:hypothetical protein
VPGKEWGGQCVLLGSTNVADANTLEKEIHVLCTPNIHFLPPPLQIRTVDIRHVQKLMDEFTVNTPAVVPLTVVQDRGGYLSMSCSLRWLFVGMGRAPGA